MAWAVTALAGLVLLAYLALLFVNRNDEPPSADAERLVAMQRDRPPLADAANGYVHLLGLATEARGDYRAARSREVSALADACADAPACADAVDAHPDAVAQWLGSEQWLLDRYRRMLATDGWREPIPTQFTAPLASFQHAIGAQNLHLLAVRQQALARDPATVRDLLDHDLVFWRKVLASSDLLISKMAAVAAVNRNFALGNLALRELPPDLADAAVPRSWRQPLTVEERSLMRSLGGEWEFVGSALRTATSPEADAADARWRVTRRLQQPLLQHQATLNLFAERMVRMGALSELPYRDIAPALERLAQAQEPPPLRIRPYNVLGNLLIDTGASSAYGDYIARTADLEGHRRAALRVATLRGDGIQAEGLAAAVRDASLRNPYDDAAFEWDAVGGAVVFRGLEQRDRGRHAVLF